MVAARYPALYQPQAVESAGQVAKAPAHLREELEEDYPRMIYAQSRDAVEQARVGFLRGSCAATRSAPASRRPVTSSSPSPLSRFRGGNALRTNNALERINEEDQDPGVATQ
jgi:hypothetical protein